MSTYLRFLCADRLAKLDLHRLGHTLKSGLYNPRRYGNGQRHEPIFIMLTNRHSTEPQRVEYSYLKQISNEMQIPESQRGSGRDKGGELWLNSISGAGSLTVNSAILVQFV
jgi:hypothetical protein